MVKHRYYREHCVRFIVGDDKFKIIKDLTRIGVPLDRVLLIDNSRSTGEWQPYNFIKVEDYSGDKKDNMLIHLERYLIEIADYKSKSIY